MGDVTLRSLMLMTTNQPGNLCKLFQVTFASNSSQVPRSISNLDPIVEQIVHIRGYTLQHFVGQGLVRRPPSPGQNEQGKVL